MAYPVMVPPGRSGALVQAPSQEMLRIRDKCEKIWKVIEDIEKHPSKREHEVALHFYGRVRAISGIVGLLAEQPGYRPADTEGDVVRKNMVPLKKKMDEIKALVDSKGGLVDPLPYTAPKRVAWMQHQTEELWKILIDEENVKDIDAIGNDKTLSYETRAVFFDWVGYFVRDAVNAVISTKKHEAKVLEAISKTLDSHEKNTMIGACLWAGQTAASAVGNLPGPNSLYVGLVRIKAIQGFNKLGPNAAKAFLGDVLPHWYDALKFSSKERDAFDDALKRFDVHHNTALSEKDPHGQQVARMKAEEAHGDLVKLMKKSGSPQSGPGLSMAVSVLNVLCLYLVWDAMPSQWDAKAWSPRNWADLTSAALTASSGICNTVIRLRSSVGLMQRIIESQALGAFIGVYVGLVAAVEGLDTFLEEIAKSKKDWWVVASSGLQFGSGVAIIIGALLGSPGLQLIGTIAGLGATLVALIDDAVQDKMVRYLTELLKQIKEAKCLWDGSLIMNNLGLTTLLEELEKLIESCKVTELAYDRNWTGPGGLIVSKSILHDKLNDLGITDGMQRDKLIRAVWV